MSSITSPCIYRYPTKNDSSIAIYPNVAQNTFDFYLEKMTQTTPQTRIVEQQTQEIVQIFSQIKINEVKASPSFEKLPANKFIEFFRSQHANLVQLNDGTYKLYLAGKLFGGTSIKELVADASDEDLSTAVISNIPKGLYSNVMVTSQSFHFPGTTGAVDARIITLSPFGDNFSDFCAGIWRFLTGFRPPTNTVYNATILAEYLLGLNPSDAEGELTLRLAYAERRHIYLYISKDGLMFHCEVEPKRRLCIIS